MDENNFNNLIENLKTMLQNNNSTNSQEESSSPTSSNSSISPDMLNNLINNYTKNKTRQSTETINSANSSGIDIDTIFKIQSIMKGLNSKDDPRANLLYSLKPYLRESRQKKIDQYVNLFKITKVTDFLKNDKGDNN